jgi:hypothetical protein
MLQSELFDWHLQKGVRDSRNGLYERSYLNNREKELDNICELKMEKKKEKKGLKWLAVKVTLKSMLIHTLFIINLEQYQSLETVNDDKMVLWVDLASAEA